MIDRAMMMSLILASFPDFDEVYSAIVADWEDEQDIPYYLVLAEFSQYLIKLLEAGQPKQLSVAFEVLERLCVEGDKYVRDAATIGIIETLQNTNLHSKTEPQQFREFMRPVTLRYWRKINEGWEQGKMISED